MDGVGCNLRFRSRLRDTARDLHEGEKVTHILLHTPVAGFSLAILAGIGIGLWLMRGYALKDKLMVSGLLGTMSPVWLEAARLAIKGVL